jgi:hypothetical protein
MLQRDTSVTYEADGTTTLWDFSFVDGYIDKSHVKVKLIDEDGDETPYPINTTNFVSNFRLQLTPALADGQLFTIYRQTPKAKLVNWALRARIDRDGLDLTATQGLFVAAENQDDMPLAQLAIDDALEARDAADASATSAALSADAAADSAAAAAQIPVDFSTTDDGKGGDMYSRAPVEIYVTDFMSMAQKLALRTGLFTLNLWQPFMDAYNYGLANTSWPRFKIILPRGKLRLDDELNVFRASSPRRDVIIEGSDQLSTIILGNFYGADKALIRSVDPGGTLRSSPLSIRNCGFAHVSQAGGTCPKFIHIEGWGESRIDGCRFAGTNNTVCSFGSAQNIRGRDNVSFDGGKHFTYKATTGKTFNITGNVVDVNSGGGVFSPGDVNRTFVTLPSDVTRRAQHRIIQYNSPTQVLVEDVILNETAIAIRFEPARGGIVSGSNLWIANANCFTPDDTGRTVAFQGAAAGAFGDGVLRAKITYSAADRVTLSVTATHTVTDEMFAVPVFDWYESNGAGSSDVVLDALQIEAYSGLALLAMNTDSWWIYGSKLHGEPTVTDTKASTSAAWFDDFGGVCEINFDSSCSTADARIVVSNQNDNICFSNCATRGIINGLVLKTKLFTDPSGYVHLSNFKSYQDFASELDLFNDANFIANGAADARVVMSGFITMGGDAQPSYLYMGRDTKYTPSGRLVSAKKNVNGSLTGVSWSGGTPPSGTVAQHYRWEQIGDAVHWTARYEATVAGASNIGVLFPLPSDMPLPATMIGLGDSEFSDGAISGNMGASASSTSLTKSYLSKDGSGNWQVQLALNSGSIAGAFFNCGGHYWTDAT